MLPRPMALQLLTDAQYRRGDTVLNLEAGTGLRQKDIKQLALLSLFLSPGKSFLRSLNSYEIEFDHLLPPTSNEMDLFCSGSFLAIYHCYFILWHEEISAAQAISAVLSCPAP